MSRLKPKWMWVWGVALLTGCQSESIHCGVVCSDEPERLFNFGFEDVDIRQADQSAYIEGVDAAYADHNNWDDWFEGDAGSLRIHYEAGDETERVAELVPDPLNPDNQVLRFQLSSSNVYQGNNPEEARIQMELNDTPCLSELVQSMRVYFPSDSVDALSQYPDSIRGLSFFEAWNNASWSGEKNPFRVILGLRKPRGVGETVVFDAMGQREGLFGQYKDSWVSTSGYPVPTDTWIDIDIYVLEGDTETGRVVMGLTQEGVERELVYDITGRTFHPDEDCTDGFVHLRPLQMVSSAEVMQFVQDQGQRLEVYWDDWTLTRNGYGAD